MMRKNLLKLSGAAVALAMLLAGCAGSPAAQSASSAQPASAPESSAQSAPASSGGQPAKITLGTYNGTASKVRKRWSTPGWQTRKNW